MPLIMVVDDDENQLKSIARALRNVSDYEVSVFSDVNDALNSIRQKDYDVVISDLRMPITDGVSFLSQVKDKQPQVSRIILSGYCDKEALYGAINIAQADRYLEKPCSPELLINTINEVLAERNLKYVALKQQQDSP
ncbi:response regulator [Pseudomonadota bacterium]